MRHGASQLLRNHDKKIPWELARDAACRGMLHGVQENAGQHAEEVPRSASPVAVMQQAAPSELIVTNQQLAGRVSAMADEIDRLRAVIAGKDEELAAMVRPNPKGMTEDEVDAMIRVLENALTILKQAKK